MSREDRLDEVIEEDGCSTAAQTYAPRMGENAFGIRVERARPSELDTVVLHRILKQSIPSGG